VVQHNAAKADLAQKDFHSQGIIRGQIEFADFQETSTPGQTIDRYLELLFGKTIKYDVHPLAVRLLNNHFFETGVARITDVIIGDLGEVLENEATFFGRPDGGEDLAALSTLSPFFILPIQNRSFF
jgi:hypothetical protein